MADHIAVRLGELAELVGGELHGDPASPVERVAALADAPAGSVTFFTNARYRKHLEATEATAVILRAESLDDCPVAAIVCDDPYRAYALIAQRLNPLPVLRPGVHASATVHPDAVLGEGVEVGPHVAIGAGARIGDRVYLGAGSVIMDDAVIGDDSRLIANVTVYHGVAIGRRAIIHAGAVLGSDGFGFAPGAEGWAKVPQVGTVRIGDDVEIGANSTIDRGALGDTVIDDDVKIDNLVHIGHNVRVGTHSAIAGCTGIAGSTTIGDRCMVGGGVGIAGHIEIASGVTITGKTAVTSAITEPGVYSSATPVAPTKQWRKNAVRFHQLDEMYRRLKALERELAALQEDAGGKNR